MNIFAYFDPNGGASPGALRLWETSWRNRGWTPRLLTPQMAERNPRFETINRRLVGTRQDRAKVWRWLAMEKYGTGFLTDVDVFNFRLNPLGYVANFANWDGLAYVGSPEVFNRLLNMLACGATDDPDFFSASEIREDLECLVSPYGSRGWNASPLVRFSGRSVSEILDCGRAVC